jgi:hypothetical protein
MAKMQRHQMRRHRSMGERRQMAANFAKLPELMRLLR